MTLQGRIATLPSRQLERLQESSRAASEGYVSKEKLEHAQEMKNSDD